MRSDVEEQLAYLAELCGMTVEISAERRDRRLHERLEVVPPPMLTDRCGCQYEWLLRGEAREAVDELLHRCSEMSAHSSLSYLGFAPTTAKERS